jgi:hypothetical protein
MPRLRSVYGTAGKLEKFLHIECYMLIIDLLRIRPMEEYFNNMRYVQ